MDQPSMSTDQTEKLLDELADALQAVVESSCAEMVPLWLAGTRLARRDLPSTLDDMGFSPSARYAGLGRGTQNRYRQLACWRHAMVWRGKLAEVDDRYRPAVEALYFTPYPAGEPPYAWSEKPSDAPDAPRFDSPTLLRDRAKRGCFQAVAVLRRELRELPFTTLYDEVVRSLVRTGCRDTLKDTLKLEDRFGRWEPL